jgi:hypothetical protein
VTLDNDLGIGSVMKGRESGEFYEVKRLWDFVCLLLLRYVLYFLMLDDGVLRIASFPYIRSILDLVSLLALSFSSHSLFVSSVLAVMRCWVWCERVSIPDIRV